MEKLRDMLTNSVYPMSRLEKRGGSMFKKFKKRPDTIGWVNGNFRGKVEEGDTVDLWLEDDVRVSVKVTGVSGDHFKGEIQSFGSGEAQHQGYHEGQPIKFEERNIFTCHRRRTR